MGKQHAHPAYLRKMIDALQQAMSSKILACPLVGNQIDAQQTIRGFWHAYALSLANQIGAKRMMQNTPSLACMTFMARSLDLAGTDAEGLLCDTDFPSAC
jgi:hypothetical protein